MKGTDINGCFNYDTITVTIDNRCAEMYFPNAFSPNGDGENDEFCFQGKSTCASEYKLLIVNRWGETVFETSNVADCWNGTYHGELLNPAVFVFYATLKTIDGIVLKKNGNITLIK